MTREDWPGGVRLAARDVAPDDVLDAVVGRTRPTTSPAWPAGPLPLVLALGRIARPEPGPPAGAPCTGRPVGLGGPPSSTPAAIEAGEAVLRWTPASGWFRAVRAPGCRVALSGGSRRPLPDVGEADRALRAARAGAATVLAGPRRRPCGGPRSRTS